MGGLAFIGLLAVGFLWWQGLANAERRGSSARPIGGMILVVVGVLATAFGAMAYVGRACLEESPELRVRIALASHQGRTGVRDELEQIEIASVLGLGGGALLVVGGLYLLVTAARRADAYGPRGG